MCRGFTENGFEFDCDERMRILKKSGNGQWRQVVERRVRISEPRVRRRFDDPKSGLMLLGEQVANATAK